MLTAVDAAKILGVSADMVRLLARDGRLEVAAQTVRGVRLFRRAEVDRLASERAGAAAHHHAVQFYDTQEFLSGVVARFVAGALRARAPVVIIARESRHEAFCAREELSGIDLDAARDSGQLAFHDAGQTLATFMVGGMPEPDLFRDRIGEIIRRAAAPRPRVRLRLYGEMVDVLWREGHRKAAVRLEQMWNQLAEEHAFALLCAYDMSGFRQSRHEEPFRAICAAHTHVGAAEASTRGLEHGERQRQFALLQQRSSSLESEIEQRGLRQWALQQAMAERDQAEASLRAAHDLLAALGRELRDPRAAIRHEPGLGDRLLDLASLTRGERELERQRLGVAELVARASESAASLLGERGHRLDVSVPAGLVVDVDPDRMAHVVTTAVTGAARRSDAGSPIHLDARREADSILISVKHQPAAAGDGCEGGAGLAIAGDLARLHGGSIADHAGELVIAIPAATDRLAESAAAEGGAAPGAGESDAPPSAARSGRQARLQGPMRRILVVDDNEDLGSLIAELLREHGHEVELALDATSALERAAAFAPDVALLDIGLPGMDGYTLARELRELRRGEVRLIAVTGYAQEADRRRSEEAGFCGHLVKPVNADELAEMVRSA